MEGCESLWSEVIRRAVMDAQGLAKSTHGVTKKSAKLYRDSYRDICKRSALQFINGGGNWELCCDVIGRDHIEYSKEILEGLDGHRRIAKRDAKRGRSWKQKQSATRAKSGQKGNGGKAGLSENLESRPARERRETEKHLAPAGSDSEGLRGIFATGHTAGTYQYIAEFLVPADPVDEGMR